MALRVYVGVIDVSWNVLIGEIGETSSKCD